MRYIVSSDNYFSTIALQESYSDKLSQYLTSIPAAFFESLEKVDFSKPLEIKTPHINYTDSEILEHQVFLIENINEFSDILKREDFLTRTGKDSIALRLNGKYLDSIRTLDEGVLGSIWNFLKLIVDDPDPTAMVLNIIRLVLDIIGLVPFTWAGMPIDIVANVLSGLISLFKGDYLSAFLSLIATLDVTKVSTYFNTSLKPLAHILNPIFKILCRSEKVVALDKEVIKLSDSIIKIGGKGAVKTVSDFFASIGKFLSGSVINIVRAFVSFITQATELIPLAGKLFKKVNPSILKAVDKMVDFLAGTGRNLNDASKLLMDPAVIKGVARTEAELTAKSAAHAAGKRGFWINKAGDDAVKAFDSKPFDLAAHSSNTYIKDLEHVVKADAKFMDSIKHLPAAEQTTKIAAKVENELIGQVAKSSEKLMSDPKLAQYVATKYGWSPSGDYLLKIAKAGDDKAVKNFFEMFVKDPKLSKNLSKAELRAFTPFAVKPEAFTIGVKNFDNCINALKAISKGGTHLAERRIPALRMINFIARLFLNKYGSMECIKQIISNTANNAIDTTKKAAVSAAVTEMESDDQFSNIASDVTAAKQSAIAQTQSNYQETPVDKPDMVQSTNPDKSPDEVKNELTSKKEKDCMGVSVATKAAIGNYMGGYPGSTAGLGGSYDVGNDPKSAANFLDKSTDYSKSILKSSGLDANIDVQHALEKNDPVTQLYFSDVWDSKVGMININTSEESRIDDNLAEMIRRGIITDDQALDVKSKALEMIRNGQPPELVIPTPANESLVAWTFSFIQNK